jgi:hypothetical protein
VHVDVIGIGAGVVDQLKTYEELDVRPINASDAAQRTTYARCRDELWFGVADWLKSGGALPNDSKLTGELAAVEYGFLPNGKIKVESKDELRARLGRSPDRADALALAVYTRATQPASFGSLPFRSRGFAFDLAAADDDEDENFTQPQD